MLMWFQEFRFAAKCQATMYLQKHNLMKTMERQEFGHIICFQNNELKMKKKISEWIMYWLYVMSKNCCDFVFSSPNCQFCLWVLWRCYKHSYNVKSTFCAISMAVIAVFYLSNMAFVCLMLLILNKVVGILTYWDGLPTQNHSYQHGRPIMIFWL